MKILIDVGNTRIKWCIEKNSVLEKGQAIEHKEVEFIGRLKQAWDMLDAPEILAISSVSHKQLTEQLIDLAKAFWPQTKVIIARSLDDGFSVTNAYQQADKLGVDRWLGLIALRHYFPGNSCVVDCGTAITIDVLNEQGQHLGGVISPGLQLMKHALFKGTENLYSIDRKFSAGLSDFTESAIYSGTLFAATGLIEKVLTNYCSCQTIVLTGGDAILLSQHLNFEFIIEPDFIFKGLSLYCKGDVAR